jgi:xylan 1,4-beta-xylosidase
MSNVTANLLCNMRGPGTALPHFWEHTVGSGHATLGLRADWQAQLKRTHDELGMKHVRFHGILSDDMSTVIDQSGSLLYSFFNADQIFDYLLSIGMRPFVELSFMPTALSSGDRTVFHYRANVTPPRDPADWSVLIRKLVLHWVERYGLDEVRQWFFEVWNEPNLTAFGTGEQQDYFVLYRYTVEAIKSVDRALKVGGPATAENAWIVDFLAFCGKNALPVYYTEWCTSSNPRDPLHDEPYAAAFIVKTVLEANGLVQGYSYWTFSDIFEENCFPSVPFQGGFGLMSIHGVAKPAYRAYELLHGLGTTLWPVEGSHATVDAWLISGEQSATLLLTNFALPFHPIETQQVSFALTGTAPIASAAIRRIDLEHANAKHHWEQSGRPEYLSRQLVAQLKLASRLEAQPQPVHRDGEGFEILVTMPPQAVAAIDLSY